MLTTIHLAITCVIALVLAVLSVSGASAEILAEPSTSLLQYTHPPVDFKPDIGRYGAAARNYQGIPTIERSPSGRLWAAWYAGKEHEDHFNYVVVATKAPDSRRWSDIKLVIDPDGDGPMRASDPCFWLDPDHRLWLFWWLNGPGELATVTMAISTDNPDSANPVWSQPRVVCHGVMINKPIVTREGSWLLPTAVWMTENSCRVMVSSDKGLSWRLRGVANVPNPADRNCDEPMLVERNDGSLMLLVRTMYGIGRAISTDVGSTWSPVERYLPDATSRFYIRRLASGKLMLVKHGPIDKRIGRSHLTAYLSMDDGETWQGGLLLDERPTVSYPDGTQMPDGLIHVIYDWNRADEKYIHMASFHESDVLIGEAASKQSQLRMKVNRATGVNAKPWLFDGRFMNLVDNTDGHPLLLKPHAEITPETGVLKALTPGTPLFQDRAYQLNSLPALLANKRFVYASINRVSVICKKAGMVYVITPSPKRNPDSAEAQLLNMGFTKAAVKEFILFVTPPSGSRYSEACSIYQKRLMAGERIEVNKWGLMVF